MHFNVNFNVNFKCIKRIKMHFIVNFNILYSNLIVHQLDK